MSSQELDDRRLADRVLQRDEAAFRTLYRRHTPMLFALGTRLSGARADAEELVQDAWVRAVEAMSGFRWESALPTWLAAILINCHRERMRRERARPMLELHEDGGDVPSRGRSVEDAITLDDAVNALPDGYRQVLVLHDIEGYRHHEIATMLGIQPGTSKSQLSRARKLLRRMLDEPDDTTHGGVAS